MKTTHPQPSLTGRVSVREAKAHLSELVEQAAAGHEITITYHGRPKATLIPVRAAKAPFAVDRQWLRRLPIVRGARPAEVLVREERDGRD
ncbi:MAG: hypothetical protein A3K19_05805 [Lentisphaerae bacterium RIFOXYB12_FULL_65_16]|nr:MAG: hypothetical protein A3K18_15420 [Lentisphaerae bacterium RIFOXYA12_64_32]OGV95087.1 MAG: hypothetical protein A3K19_05805 [Lentisphaerae bacterium RIFOXYB12_FULL_65_16]